LILSGFVLWTVNRTGPSGRPLWCTNYILVLPDRDNTDATDDRGYSFMNSKGNSV